MKTLDDIDRRLLALLKDDARLPVAALAKAVGLSRSATQERIDRLEKSRVITGYTTRVGAAGEPGVQAWLAIRFAAGHTCADVMPSLAALPEVRLAHAVAGPVDLWVLVGAATLADVDAVRTRVVAMPGVAHVETTPVLHVRLDRLST